MKFSTAFLLPIVGGVVALPQLGPGITRPDAVVKTVRYGPHVLKKAEGTATDPKGVKTTILRPSVEKPCIDCTLISMTGGVQYSDGTEATGPDIYLHHAATINVGPLAKDGTCGRPAYDLFFSTGNERSRLIYSRPNSTVPTGYYINSSDQFLLQSEVVNNALEEKTVYVTMNYEYIPGKQPRQQQTKVAWLSADGKSPCERKTDLKEIMAAAEKSNELGAGELWPPNDKKFTLKSKTWVSPWSGEFLAMGGHLHDGGVNTAIYQNGNLLCDSRANYAAGAGHAMGGASHSAPATQARHIASMTGCRSSAKVVKGDKFDIVVNYDFEANQGMRDKNDKLLPIMAAATLFIGAIE